MKGAGFWIIIIVLIVVALGGLYLLSGGSNESSIAGVPLAVPVSAADHNVGTADAVVTLVEYGDFQCSACADFHPVLKSFKDEFGSDLQVVYRHYPLRAIHPNAQISAQAAEAAGLQGRFWEMHDMLYENQSTWESLSQNDARDTFEAFAEALELDVEKFNLDIDTDAVKDAVSDDFEGGQLSGVPGTPTVFINGELFQPQQSYAEVRQVILNELADRDSIEEDEEDEIDEDIEEEDEVNSEDEIGAQPDQEENQ